MRSPAPILLAAALLLLAPAATAQSEFERRWQSRVASFERENAALPADARTVVLFGSSSMEGWRYGDRVRRFLPPGYRFLNRGISGDGIGFGRTGLLNRLDSAVFAARPSHVFILNGRNSIGMNGSRVDATADLFREVVRRIRERMPEVVVCVITDAPTNHGYRPMAPHVVTYNARLRAIAAELGCPLIDLHPLLADDRDLLPTRLTRDGLHFLDAGYRLLGDEIARVLRDHPGPAAPLPAVTPPPPPVTTPPPAPAPEPPAPAPTCTVRRGDTLWAIARRHGTTVRRLVELNGITDPSRIHVGQVLLLPVPSVRGMTDQLDRE